MQASGLGPPAPPTGSLNFANNLNDGRGGAGLAGNNSHGEFKDASSAWKHCKNVARDDGRTPDLYDLLSHSVRETQYSFPPQGWPSQARMLSPVVNEMPAMVTDRYNACQTVAFCGVFPEIRRAWASVDNSLFLWRFDKWQDVPIEYSGEDQAIVSVGLCTPIPGIFVEAIRYLLVVCTTTEIVLVGVCCSGGADGCEEIAIQPLPLYSVPSDNVAMTAVVGSQNGRIFMGGADGNLYEVKYAAGDSWSTKRCQKVCHTGGLRQLLPSFLPDFLFGAPQALVDIVIDHHRNFLYTRTQASAIQLYDLGAEGKDAPKRSAEVSEFLAEASRAMGGREVFGRGAGDKKGAAVVHMAVIPHTDSRRLHLVTVTADGRRVYWACTTSRTIGGPAGPRPDRLRAEIARQAMPSPSAAARAAGGAHHAPSRGLEVVAAGYACGTLLLAEAAPGEARTRLFLLSRDLTVPPVGTATGAHVAVAGLRESISELEAPLPGEACAVRPTLLALNGVGASARDALTTQNTAAAPRFAVVTTAGVVEVERLRPINVLAQLLQEPPGSAKLEMFFRAYAVPEAAAMCIQLAASGPPAATAAVVANAKAALDNPSLCGEPQVREVADGGAGAAEIAAEEPAAHLYSGFDMGAVVPVEEPEWSGAHKGLCLYVARLLQPTWDQPIVAPLRSSASMLRCALPLEALAALEDRLRALDSFLVDFLARRKARRRAGIGGDAFQLAGQPANKRQRVEDAVRLELKRTEAVRALVARAADACFLLRALVEHNVSRLSARVEDSTRATLRALRFRDWVTEEDGETAAAALIAALVSEHLSAAGGLAEDLAAALQAGCPSYFRENDRVYYNASGLLRRAEGAPAAADREAFARDAVAQLARVPLACDLGQVVPQLAALRALDAVVDLCEKKAAAIDPGNTAVARGVHGETAKARRAEAAYSHVAAVLRVLVDPAAPAPPQLEPFAKGIAAAERAPLRQALLRRIVASPDGLLHEAAYATLVDAGAVRELLSMDTPFLEAYLVSGSGLAGAAAGTAVGPLSATQVAHADVLARFYIGRGEYAAAAGVHELLAGRAAALAEAPDPPLARRVAHLQAAVLQARSCGDATLVDRLEAKVRVAEVQATATDALAAALAERRGEADWAALGLELAREDAEGAVEAMRRALYSLEELYNDVTRPAHLWAQCLELLDVSSVSDPPYLRQLWDLQLRAEWERGWASSPAGGDDESKAAAALRTAADSAAALGELFYPNESSFPVASVLLRLEEAAAGAWPRPTCIMIHAGPAQRAVLAACGGSFEAAVRAYEALLSARASDPHGEELQSPALRLRLLRSLRDIVAAGRDRASERAPAAGYAGVRAGRRELGVLAAACEAYAAEARRLPAGGEALGEEFAALGDSLAGLIGYGAGSGRMM